MKIPVQRYFRVLVVGAAHAPVADAIEEELGFRVECADADQSLEAVRTGADLCAIVVGRDEAEAVLAARRERGFEMPVFLVSERNVEVFQAAYLREVKGVLVPGLESRDFYKRTLLTAIEEYVASLLTPFFGRLLQYDYDGEPLAGPARGTRGARCSCATRSGGSSSSTWARTVFRDDICNAMVSLGDLLIREGPGARGADSRPRRSSAPTGPTSCSTAPRRRTRWSTPRCCATATSCCSTATTTSRTTTAR